MNKLLSVSKPVLQGSIFALAVAGFPSGDASAATDAERHPVNCATAEGDLRAIEAEKKHAEDKQLESVASLTPAGALLGLVTGTEHKHLQMLSGDYVKALSDRAAEIKETCNLN
ncbi:MULTISPECIES: hypothetical protein [unclassified Ruegeria]|uniref:hypothetical protein n=1 Tax=unclassified Ruegeria TaxID=2625375 RepID=UPI0014899FF8|nr:MULTISPECIES: hypothetical protein [unclassified Ruegeria]NOD87231.1 hypothetical protein [Ruegeria sp. HKCCD4318]NOD91342.1 hypothetical protein [Ruegeria sp. HKCCD4884]NOE12786.1 hypothetical protein [Ruegeria sp. HKCCD4318-2]NOG09048.1 hypothetical protein [Ruegeria sp. HKCCD4315]